MSFTLTDPRYDLASLGLIPFMIDSDSPTPAGDQINSNYAHGGGFSEIKGFGKLPGYYQDTNAGPIFSVQFPGDRRLHPIAYQHMPRSNEMVVVYPSAFVGVFNLHNDTFKVTRMD